MEDLENINADTRQKISMIKSAPKEKQRAMAERLWLIM